MIQYIYAAIPDIPKSYTPTLMRRINTPVKDSSSEAEKKGMPCFIWRKILAIEIIRTQIKHTENNETELNREQSIFIELILSIKGN